MSATRMSLKAERRVVPRWWWALFFALVALDFMFTLADVLMNRRFPTGLQTWALVQALVAIVAVSTLAVSLRDLGYAIVGGVFIVLTVEDWLQVLAPLRLELRRAAHNLLPWLGEAPRRLSAPDPIDLAILLAASSVLLVAFRVSRPENRIHVMWLTGFLAIGFVFGGLFDLYNDYNWSRLGIFIEEAGEAVAVSGSLAYLVGVAFTRLDIGSADRPPR